MPQKRRNASNRRATFNKVARAIQAGSRASCWYTAELCEFCKMAMATNGTEIWCASAECQARQEQQKSAP